MRNVDGEAAALGKRGFGKVGGGKTDIALWIAFVAMSTVQYAFGTTEKTMDRIGAYYAAGLIDAVLTCVLVWRYGLTMLTPIVLAIYVFTNRWFFYLLFLSIILWPGA